MKPIRTFWNIISGADKTSQSMTLSEGFNQAFITVYEKPIKAVANFLLGKKSGPK